MMSSIETVTNPQCMKLVQRLEASAERTQEFFQAIENEQWYLQVYSEGANWTVQHILAHFVVAEASITRLIRYILQGLPGVPEDFDVDSFNEREVSCFSKLPVDMVLERFIERRAETIQMVSQLQDDDLEKQGRHPWFGMASIGDMIKLMYRHNQIHQRDIRRTIDS